MVAFGLMSILGLLIIPGELASLLSPRGGTVSSVSCPESWSRAAEVETLRRFGVRLEQGDVRLFWAGSRGAGVRLVVQVFLDRRGVLFVFLAVTGVFLSFVVRCSFASQRPDSIY